MYYTLDIAELVCTKCLRNESQVSYNFDFIEDYWPEQGGNEDTGIQQTSVWSVLIQNEENKNNDSPETVPYCNFGLIEDGRYEQGGMKTLVYH